jgi:translation initiation factor 2 gamma subunit (eIF-2gamma)
VPFPLPRLSNSRDLLTSSSNNKGLETTTPLDPLLTTASTLTITITTIEDNHSRVRTRIRTTNRLLLRLPRESPVPITTMKAVLLALVPTC